jgi:DNA-binding NarL/FixJ family response regulator
MGEKQRIATDGQIVLRVSQEGRIVGMSEGARNMFGHDELGKMCDRAVRGASLDGAPICRQGCAAQLACGSQASPPAREAKIRQKRASLRCTRVGNEVIVVADRRESHDATERLTPREREVLKLVGQGLSSSAIADHLGISAATVRTHVEHALGRLGAKTRAEAVLRAMRTGQLAPTAE